MGGWALWIIVWFYALSTRALGEPDEGRYAEVAREMWASGDWLTPRLDGFNFFDKPPLHYWATALAYAAFGVNPFSARLWCALTSLMSMAAIYATGYRLFNRETGTCAALMLGSSLLFMLGAHINTLDMGVAAFLTVAVALFMLAQFDTHAIPHRFALTCAMWLAIALAVLSKGLIGVVLPGTALVVYACWQRDFGILRRVSPFTGALIILLVCAPWFVWMCRAHPEFFDYFFIRQHFTRFLTNEDNRDKPIWFYIPVVLIGLFPWCVLTPLRKMTVATTVDRQPVYVFLLSWIVVILAFFSISHSKLPFYILPVMPALSLLMAAVFVKISTRELIVRLCVLAALLICVCVCAPFAGPYIKAGAKGELINDSLLTLAKALLPILLATVAGIALVYARRRRAIVWIVSLASLGSWQWALQSYSAYPDFNTARSAAALLQPAVDADTRVYTLERNIRGLPFYLRHSVVIVGHAADDISPALSSNPTGYVADVTAFEELWKHETNAVALIPIEQMHEFTQRGLPYYVLGKTSSLVAISRSTAANANNGNGKTGLAH